MWYTGKGDEGDTGLIGGERTTKDSPRIEALGDLDEADSAIGLARAFLARKESGPVLLRVQRELYLFMAEVASQEPDRLPQRIGAEMVAALEDDIAALEGMLPREQVFIVPGDSRGSAALDLARTVVRRAERRITGLTRQGYLPNEQLLRYLNRLSSLLYMLARADDLAAGVRPTTIQ